MPCHHELCLPCFKLMTDQTSLLCPICRLRISTWSRNASNSNSLVNTTRWEQIQRKFPSEVKNRIDGKSAQIVADSIEKYNKLGVVDETYRTVSTVPSISKVTPVHVAEPGEIRNEYLEYLRREKAKLKEEQESEERASIELIQKLVQEEEHVPFDTYMNLLNHEQNVRPSSVQPRSSGIQRSESMMYSGYATIRARRPLPQANCPRSLDPRNETSTRLTGPISTADISSNEAAATSSVNRHVTPIPVISLRSRQVGSVIASETAPGTSNYSENTPELAGSAQHESNLTEPKRRGALGLSRNVSITAASLRKRPNLSAAVATISRATTSSAHLDVVESRVSTLRRTGTTARRVKLDVTAEASQVMDVSSDSASIISIDDSDMSNTTRSLRSRVTRK
jgi:hypothetical protein